MSNRWVMMINVLSVALLGALTTQVFHELLHGLAALAVGAEWQAFNLFAILWAWPDSPNEMGALIIEATPALINILTGLLAVWVFGRSLGQHPPMWSLFWMYVAAYSLFMGFGYLVVDPLFYQPGSERPGDWQKVIDLLGGLWLVRIPMLLVGTAGTLWGFFWLARAALRFANDASDQRERPQVALPLLLIPYLVINTLFTLLAFWHPLGGQGMVIVGFQYWFGYIGFFWGFFLAAYWLDVHEPLARTSKLPTERQPVWWASATIALLLAVGILLPTLEFA